MKMYRILIIPVIVSIVIILCAAILTGMGNSSPIDLKSDNWQIKEKQERSRLLEVPIILYHDIDGKGPFSISSETLREHFEYFKINNIGVVPLHDLLYRLDHPKSYNRKVIVITFDDGYNSMYTKLLPLVNEYHYPVTLFVYSDNIGSRGTKILTWTKLKELQQAGIDIQSHTITHPDFVQLSNQNTPDSHEKIYQEMEYSRRILEKRLGKKIDLLAFPFGRFNLKIIQYAHNAGYSRVFSTNYGSNIVTENNFCLRRHHIKRSYGIEQIAEIIR